MMKPIFFALALVSAVFAATLSVKAQAAVVDSIDASSPLNAGSYNTPDFGFLYTPGFSYTLDGIETEFGATDSRTVTIAIYSGLPGSLSFLASGSVNPVANTFVTATISPFLLTSGTTYFVAFENLNGLASNITLSGPTSVTFYQDDGDLSFGTGPNFQQDVGPLVQFDGVASAVPEPSTWAMLILGFAGIGAMTYRRRKSAMLAA
jgi:hypothetical protein